MNDNDIKTLDKELNVKKLEKLGYLEIIRDKKDPNYNPKYTTVKLTQKYKDEFT